MAIVMASNERAESRGFITGLGDMLADAKAKREQKVQAMTAAATAPLIASDGTEYSFAEAFALGNDMPPEIRAELEARGIDVNSMLTAILYTSFTSPDYEWTQFDSKKGKAVIDTNGLILVSGEDNQQVISVAEFNFDAESTDFEYGIAFTATKAEEGKFVGLVFDYENNRNFKAFVVSKKDFMYFTVDNGETSIVKQGLAKPGKTIDNLTLKRVGQKILVQLNGVDVTSINRIKISNPVLGVMVQGKGKAFCTGFLFKLPEENEDTEQSTSDI